VIGKVRLIGVIGKIRLVRQVRLVRLVRMNETAGVQLQRCERKDATDRSTECTGRRAERDVQRDVQRRD